MNKRHWKAIAIATWLCLPTLYVGEQMLRQYNADIRLLEHDKQLAQETMESASILAENKRRERLLELDK